MRLGCAWPRRSLRFPLAAWAGRRAVCACRAPDLVEGDGLGGSGVGASGWARVMTVAAIEPARSRLKPSALRIEANSSPEQPTTDINSGTTRKPPSPVAPVGPSVTPSEVPEGDARTDEVGQSLQHVDADGAGARDMEPRGTPIRLGHFSRLDRGEALLRPRGQGVRLDAMLRGPRGAPRAAGSRSAAAGLSRDGI